MVKGWIAGAGALAGVMLAGFAAAQDAEPAPRFTITAAQAGEDIALARRALETIHPGYDRYEAADNLDQAWTWISARAQGSDAVPVAALYEDLSALAATIRCDHTKAELPGDMAAYLDDQPTHLPVRFVWVEDRMIVTHAAESAGLTAGEEILAIDEEPVRDIYQRLAYLLPVDGDTDFTKPKQFARTSEFRGSALDHFLGLGALDDDWSGAATLTIASPEGAERTITVERVSYPSFTAIDGGQRYRNFKDEVEFTPIGQDGGVLTVNTFVNYRDPVDPAALYGPIFARLKEEGRDKLIVDLRQNGGGSDDAMYGLLAYLIAGPVTIAEEVWVKTYELGDLKEHINTWDQAALNPDPNGFEDRGDGTSRLKPEFVGRAMQPVTPAATAFDGELVVLIGANNASGVTHMIGGLRQGRPDVTLIGEPTGGAASGATANIIFFFELPHSGITIRIPAQRTVTTPARSGARGLDGFDPRFTRTGYRRLGHAPDIPAPMTVRALRQGADPAMDAALALFSLEQ